MISTPLARSARKINDGATQGGPGRYDAGLSLANTVSAPGSHQLQVTAYYQAADHPAITGLKLWTSTDGGVTWHAAVISGSQDGSFTASYTVPALRQTDGYVSIKATAQDAAGGDISQTIDRAYQLVAAGH